VYHRPVGVLRRGVVGLCAALVACGAAPHPAAANPCPCRDDYVAGRHLYVAAPQKSVRIQAEALTFQVQRPTGWLHDIVVEVAVDYVLVNGGAARELVIGFPISDVHDRDGSPSSFQVRGDGVGARVVPEAAERSRWLGKAAAAGCETDTAQPDAGQYFEWFLWKQTLRAGATRLHVRYLQRWFVENGEMTFRYVLRTARVWGDGRIGDLRVELRDPNLPSKLRWKATPPPTERRDHGRLLVWSLPNHLPARDLDLAAKYIPDPNDPGDY
jgi:hypothetical protein